jgi:hypothetical protein
MSPASYLTAPPRVAGRSIARLASRNVLVVLWIALGVAVVVSGTAFVSAVRVGLQAWRAFRGASRALSGALADLAVRLERFADRAGATPAHAPELEVSRDRLQASLARLGVLRAAVDEATDAAGRVTVFYPRK